MYQNVKHYISPYEKINEVPVPTQHRLKYNIDKYRQLKNNINKGKLQASLKSICKLQICVWSQQGGMNVRNEKSLQGLSLILDLGRIEGFLPEAFIQNGLRPILWLFDALSHFPKYHVAESNSLNTGVVVLYLASYQTMQYQVQENSFMYTIHVNENSLGGSFSMNASRLE